MTMLPAADVREQHRRDLQSGGGSVDLLNRGPSAVRSPIDAMLGG
ncbi:MAG: hypothetical protein ACT4P5_04445 [Armatimonadota bacterium]